MKSESENKIKSGSYRCYFNFGDPVQMRLYDFLSQLSQKDRHLITVFALNLVGRAVNYTIPSDGVMGILTQMALGNSASPPQPLTPLEEIREKHQITSPENKKTRTKKNTSLEAFAPQKANTEPEEADLTFEDTGINKKTDISDDEDDSEVADFILGTLEEFM